MRQAAKSITIEPLPGMPNPNVGTISPAWEAFCAASFAATPSMDPWPYSSGCFDHSFDCW